MVSIKSATEIAKLREGGQILAGALEAAKDAIEPGVTTKSLEEVVVKYLADHQSEPSFKNFRGYPAGACVCLNEEIVHGIPGPRKIKKGDLVSVDVGVRYKGLYTDAAFTVPVGKIDARRQELVAVTKEALDKAIATIKPGSHLGDIGHAVESLAGEHNLAVIRDLVGHGVGHRVHEEPQIPNFGEAGQGLELKAGMVLALEPMLALGGHEVSCLEDGWTFVTADGELAAHFEHTLVVTENGVEILTG